MTGDDLLPYITRGPAILVLIIGLPSILFGYYVMNMLGLRIVTARLPALAPIKRRLVICLLISTMGIALAISAQFTTWARSLTAVQLADTLNHAGRPGITYYLSFWDSPMDSLNLLAQRDGRTVASAQIKRVDLQAVITAIKTGSITGVDPSILTVMEEKP
jgi:hypothetical protein